MDLFIIKSGEEYEPSTTHGIVSSEAGAQEAIMWLEALEINRAFDLSIDVADLNGRTHIEWACKYVSYTAFWYSKYELDSI